MHSRNFAAWMAQPAHNVAIIGASGWIGRGFVHEILEAADNLPPERLRLFSGRGGPLTVPGRTFATETLHETTRLAPGSWLIVNAGVIGADQPRARERNEELLERVLGLAEAVDGRLLHLSSGAADGSETTRSRTAYALMKADQEGVVARWAAAHGRHALLPRVFNLGGPYITSAPNYALGDFILGLKENGQIEMTSARPVFRSFVHVLEMAAVLLDMAVDDDQGRAPFDVGGAEIVELGALARVVADYLGQDAARISRPAPDGAAADWYVGDGRRYQTAVFQTGRRPVSLKCIVADTADYLLGKDGRTSAD